MMGEQDKIQRPISAALPYVRNRQSRAVVPVDKKESGLGGLPQNPRLFCGWETSGSICSVSLLEPRWYQRGFSLLALSGCRCPTVHCDCPTFSGALWLSAYLTSRVTYNGWWQSPICLPLSTDSLAPQAW